MSADLGFFTLDRLHACGGRHLCAPLRPAPHAPDMSRARRTSLWAEGNTGTSELDLQQSIACSEDALSLLAGESAPPSLVMREIGGSGGIDVAAFFSGADRLLLIDCKNSKPATPKGMRDQRVQANRLVLSTLSNITPLPSLISVVLLAGWSAHADDSSFEHLPGWRAAEVMSRVPSPERWGLIPFAAEGDDQPNCVIGRWDTFATQEWSATMKAVTLAHRPYGRVKHLSSGLTLREDGPSLITLRVPASEYAAATGATSSSNRVRALLDAAYTGRLDTPGIVFLGETNEKGNIRLCFSGDDSDAWDRLVLEIEGVMQGPV